MSIAFENDTDSRRREEYIAIADFVGEMTRQFRSPDLVFRRSAQSVSSVVDMLIKCDLLSEKASKQQLKKTIESVESAMFFAFDIRLSSDRVWQLFAAKAALDAAELLKPQKDRVKNAETIILSLFYNSVSEASVLFPDAPQNSMPRLSVQSSARSSKPFKTIAIILAVVACLVGICAAISSRDWEVDASAAESTSVAVMQQTESDKSDGYVYVTPSGKKYHKQGCWTLSKSKSLTKLTVEEAESKRYDPCSICFDD